MSLVAEVRARQKYPLPPPAERRAIRIAAGVSQLKIAREIGASAPAVGVWERGPYDPSDRFRVPYAKLLAALKKAVEQRRDGSTGR